MLYVVKVTELRAVGVDYLVEADNRDEARRKAVIGDTLREHCAGRYTVHGCRAGRACDIWAV